MHSWFKFITEIPEKRSQCFLPKLILVLGKARSVWMIFESRVRGEWKGHCWPACLSYIQRFLWPITEKAMSLLQFLGGLFFFMRIKKTKSGHNGWFLQFSYQLPNCETPRTKQNMFWVEEIFLRSYKNATRWSSFCCVSLTVHKCFILSSQEAHEVGISPSLTKWTHSGTERWTCSRSQSLNSYPGAELCLLLPSFMSCSSAGKAWAHLIQMRMGISSDFSEKTAEMKTCLLPEHRTITSEPSHSWGNHGGRRGDKLLFSAFPDAKPVCLSGQIPCDLPW